MAGIPGWYPDPGGIDGQYRYWDGGTWSAITSSDPRQPPPPPGAVAATPPRRGARRALAVLAVLLVVVIVAVALLIRQPRTIIDYGPAPTGTESAFDDRSPDPTPTPTATATPTPDPTPTADPTPSETLESDPDDPEGLVSCPAGGPNERAAHPTDDRVYGGNLSFTAVSSFLPAAPEARLSFARDVTQQYVYTNRDPNWIAQLAVGQLRAADGFDGDARDTAEGVAECAVSSNLWARGAPTAKQLESTAFTVSGRKGWKVTVDVTVSNPGLPFAGDRAVFVVVPDGDDWGLFFGAVPIGDKELIGVMDGVVDDLRVG